MTGKASAETALVHSYQLTNVRFLMFEINIIYLRHKTINVLNALLYFSRELELGWIQKFSHLLRLRRAPRTVHIRSNGT